jgi:hypothetical protein
MSVLSPIALVANGQRCGAGGVGDVGVGGISQRLDVVVVLEAPGKMDSCSTFVQNASDWPNRTAGLE